jgi:alkylation response protein AidB-like acyl-CoA dehydrogenase
VQFALSEEQVILRDAVERFVSDRYDFSQRRRYRAESIGYSRENWQTLAELGLFGLPFLTEDGGLGSGPRELAAVMEALGSGLVVEPVLEEVLLAGGLMARAGQPALKEHWLPRIISGDAHLTVAHFEHSARFNLADVRVRAYARGGGYVLNGHKTVVPLAAAADAWLVSARDHGESADPGGIGFYLVSATAGGIERRDYRLADGSSASSIHFSNASTLERLSGGFEDFLLCVDVARFAACAEMIGIMSRLFDMTLQYLRSRKQFGVPLASFQALQHRLVDHYVLLEQSRSHLIRAALFLQGGDGGSASVRRSIAGVKSYVSRTAVEIGESCLHLHGGMGMTDELAVGHGYKRLLVLASLFGDADFELVRYANLSVESTRRPEHSGESRAGLLV